MTNKKIRKQETWNFHKNQVFQQLQELRIWIREDNGEKKSSFLHETPVLTCSILLQSIIKVFQMFIEI